MAEFDDFNTKIIREFRENGGQVGGPFEGAPLLILHTTGAKSGTVRESPVMYKELGGSYAVFASKGGAPEHPAWYRNLVDHPLVEVQDATAKGDFTARELSGDERAQWWERAVAVWPDYAEYQKNTDREIPVFVLEPVN